MPTSTTESWPVPEAPGKKGRQKYPVPNYWGPKRRKQQARKKAGKEEETPTYNPIVTPKNSMLKQQLLCYL